jgi:hypothetical protein
MREPSREARRAGALSRWARALNEEQDAAVLSLYGSSFDRRRGSS